MALWNSRSCLCITLTCERDTQIMADDKIETINRLQATSVISRGSYASGRAPCFLPGS